VQITTSHLNSLYTKKTATYADGPGLGTGRKIKCSVEPVNGIPTPFPLMIGFPTETNKELSLYQ